MEINEFLLTQAGKKITLHILYRKSLSRALSSRWLQVAVEFQQADGLQTETHAWLFYCLQVLVYCILAVLPLTKQQVLSPILLESSPFNHPPQRL